MRDTLRLREYAFNIRPLSGEDGGGYLIEFPDVHGCISDGATAEEAVRNGIDALKCALLTLKELGMPVPEPGASFQASGQWRQRVPKSLHARLAERARAEGVSLNTLVTAMIAEGLGKRQGRQRG